MSGLVGVFHASGSKVDPALIASLMARQPSRGSSELDVMREEGAALAVSRHDWERTPEHSGDVLLVDDGEVVVAADACLYYRTELSQRIAAAGGRVDANTPAHHILAAYRTWGTACVEPLEGDFSFVLYDRRNRTVLCARDFAGRRPLFYAELGETFVVASTVSAVLAHPACPGDFNLSAIGAAAAGLIWSYGADTAYQAIHVVPMATAVTWGTAGLSTRRFWSPPPVGADRSSDFEAAALHLRELLGRSVTERMAPSGATAVWMSGGRDSTAVYGAGKHALSADSEGRSLRPISISYPEGDLGREDDFIQAVAARWDDEVRWVDIADIPLFDRDAERARSRNEPLTTPYENWNATLARETRAAGSRIALDGNGGDQLFRVSDIFLSDLLRRGRLRELRRELEAKRARGRRYLFEMTVQPLLPMPCLRLLNRLQFKGGGWDKHYLEFPIPEWIRPDFLEGTDLIDRQRSVLPQRGRRNREQTELHWLVTSPMPGYVLGVRQQRFLEAGIDARAPLMDRRIVEFALGRPRRERNRLAHDKFLLRHAMSSLIPDDVLAPRDRRTGITVSYSRRSMRESYPRLFAELLATPLRLAELGIVQPGQLKDSLSSYLVEGGEFRRIALFHALQAELWLRARA